MATQTCDFYECSIQVIANPNTPRTTIGSSHFYFCSHDHKDRFDKERGLACGWCGGSPDPQGQYKSNVTFQFCDQPCKTAFDQAHP